MHLDIASTHSKQCWAHVCLHVLIVQPHYLDQVLQGCYHYLGGREGESEGGGRGGREGGREMRQVDAHAQHSSLDHLDIVWLHTQLA